MATGGQLIRSKQFKKISKEVQERLGHKDVKTTMNIYAHVSPEKVKETGERFASYVNF